MTGERKSVSSRGRLFGWNTVIMEDGSPYMTRAWIGRLRLHIFYRGDLDPDPHDHPWPFWTFPLTSYVEEVTTYQYRRPWDHKIASADKQLQVVEKFRLHYRPATHCHRVLGLYYGLDSYNGGKASPMVKEGKVVTIVWRGKEERAWGFLKTRDGKWCWVAFRDYVFNGGKHGPCEDE